MAYTVIRQPGFQAAIAALSRNMHPNYMVGVTWTLEHDPHVGQKISANVWIIKVLWAPVVATIYYAINEPQNTVYLLDVTT